jgi:ubiquinone/menaquinone biosynthesis C-methylase UbiE
MSNGIYPKDAVQQGNLGYGQNDPWESRAAFKSEGFFTYYLRPIMIINISLVERLLHRLHLLPTPIMDAFGGVVFGRALTIAARRGVFEAMADAPHTVAEVARVTNLSAKGIELLLQSFEVARYVRAVDGSYSLTSEARKWLLKDSRFYIGNLIQYFETLYTRWGYLESSLEHGTPPRTYYEGFTGEDWRVYVYAMRDLARLLLDEVMRMMNLQGSPQSLLDLGGSHGLYAMECCRRYPSLRATIIDFAEALHHARGIVEEEGMGSHVQLLAADFTAIRLPMSQDCVLMFNVVHGLSEEENNALVQRALQALKPGGKLYILDQLREEKGRTGLSRFMPLMVGLNLLNEVGGTVYTFEQVRRWCADAVTVKRIHLRMPGVSLVEATR